MAPPKRRGAAPPRGVKEADKDAGVERQAGAQSEPQWRRLAKRFCMLLVGVALRFAYDTVMTGWRAQNEGIVSMQCWAAVDKARQEMQSASAVLNETLLAWARRHGFVARGGGVRLRDSLLRGLEVATAEPSSADARVVWPNLDLNVSRLVLRIPVALAMFIPPAVRAVNNTMNLSCLISVAQEESPMVGLVLLVLVEARRGSASLWAPYLASLPTLDDFLATPTLASKEADLPGNVSELMAEGREAHAELSKALSERPADCLLAQDLPLNMSFEEYMWARLVVLTRAVETTICDHREVLALVPVLDEIREASGDVNAASESCRAATASSGGGESSSSSAGASATPGGGFAGEGSDSSSGSCASDASACSRGSAEDSGAQLTAPVRSANAKLVVPRRLSPGEEPWIEVIAAHNVAVGDELVLDVGSLTAAALRGDASLADDNSSIVCTANSAPEQLRTHRRWAWRRTGKGR